MQQCSRNPGRMTSGGLNTRIRPLAMLITFSCLTMSAMRRLLVVCSVLSLLASVAGASKESNAQSETVVLERSSDFTLPAGVQWQGGGVQLAAGQNKVTLSGSIRGLRPFDELVPSWNVVGSGSVTLEVRPAGGQRYFSFGTWSAAGRSSINHQADSSAGLLTDTLRLNSPATAFDYRLTLRGGATLRLLAFNTSRRSTRLSGLGAAGNPALWGKVINVPQRSQMLYPDGGEAWCSPTSTSMILAYYGLDHTVPDTARATYDTAYAGTGNWAFNVAYAGNQGMRGLVMRLPNLAEAEKYLAAGIPLGVSLGWKKGELPGAAVSYSDGHLMVLVGFDKQGDPVLNDPAAPSNATVRRTYPRRAFEQLWLSHSGGVSYVITRPGTVLPH